LGEVERAELNQPFIEPLCGRLLNVPVEKGAKALLKLEIDQKLLRCQAEPPGCLFGPKDPGQGLQLIRSRVPLRIENFKASRSSMKLLLLNRMIEAICIRNVLLFTCSSTLSWRTLGFIDA